MAQPSPLQDQFLRMERDRPRNKLREGSLWTMQDVLPGLGAPLRGRGGWQYASNDISAVHSGADYVLAGIYALYAAGATNLALSNNAGNNLHLVKIASNGTVTDAGALTTDNPPQNPVMHRDKVIITYSASAPQKVTNSAGSLTIAALGGSPPSARYATVWNDYTVLGYSSANPNRVWFSDPGDPEGWDTTNSYWDFSQPVTGLASMRRAILVFHDGAISRLVGSTPPPGSDFDAADPLFNVGCPDARSIAVYGDRMIFANQEGIFITDGSAQPASLTRLCGMQRYWRDAMASYAGPSTQQLIGGIFQNYYFITMLNGSTPEIGAMIDMDTLSWLNLSNVDATCYWSAEATADELYFGVRGAPRAGKLSTIFQPGAANKNDGDATAVTPVVETPYYEGDPGEKGWRNLLVGYELTDHASDNPALTVSYIKTPEATSYTALSGTLAENTKRRYGKKDLGFAADGVAFKVQQANAGDLKLYSVEADVHRREASRRAA